MKTLRTKSGDRLADMRGYQPRARKPWCLIANRSEAVAYRDLENRFWFVKRLYNASGDLLESQLDSDKPGRGYSSATGTIRHALDRRSFRHEQIAREFAQKIGAMLDAAAARGEFTDLVLAAEPHFLGLLRNALTPRVHARLRNEVNRGFTKGSSDQLRERIRNAIDHKARREIERKPDLEAQPEKKPGLRFFRKPGQRKATRTAVAVSSSR